MIDIDARVATETKELLAGHVMRPDDTRSFRFRRADGRSEYWFQLTWNPGHLHLSGDCGNLALTHYHALGKFEEGMNWAAESGADYLLGKSDKQREYDSEGTLRHIVDDANRPVIEAMNGYVTYRMVKPEGWVEGQRLVSVRHRENGFRHELQDWRREPEEGRWDRDDLGDPRVITPRMPAPGVYWNDDTPLSDMFEFDECWGGWLRLWRLTIGEGYFHGSKLISPRDVLHPAKRREIKRELKDRLEDAHAAGETCRRLGFDDWYGHYEYSHHSAFQIEVIRFGCRMILDGIRAARDAFTGGGGI